MSQEVLEGFEQELARSKEAALSSLREAAKRLSQPGLSPEYLAQLEAKGTRLKSLGTYVPASRWEGSFHPWTKEGLAQAREVLKARLSDKVTFEARGDKIHLRVLDPASYERLQREQLRNTAMAHVESFRLARQKAKGRLEEMVKASELTKAERARALDALDEASRLIRQEAETLAPAP